MGFEPVTSRLNIGYKVEPPSAPPPISNYLPKTAKIFSVMQRIILEPLINDHLPYFKQPSPVFRLTV